MVGQAMKTQLTVIDVIIDPSLSSDLLDGHMRINIVTRSRFVCLSNVDLDCIE